MKRLSRRKMLGIIGVAPIAGGLLTQASGQDSSPNSSSREMIRQRYFSRNGKAFKLQIWIR